MASNYTDYRDYADAIKVRRGRETFTCKQYITCRGNHGFSSISEHILWKPELTKKGTVRVHQPPSPAKMPDTWWKAQCVFRGLPAPPKATIEELQASLKGHENDLMIEELQTLQTKMKEAYSEKNEVARKAFHEKAAKEAEEKWTSGTMDEAEKLKVDTQRYLSEALPADGDKKKTITLKLLEYGQIQAVATQIGIICELTGAPPFIPVKTRDPCSGYLYYVKFATHWCVIGRDSKVVKSQISSINDQGRKRKREIADHEEIEKAKKQKIKDELANWKDWDITGKWNVDFPRVEKDWDKHRDYTLVITQEETKKGPQMFASFDFGVLKGVFRFERQKGEKRAPVTSSGKCGNEANREDGEDVEDDKDDEDDEDDEEIRDYDPWRRSPTPELFYLGKKYKVTKKCATWNYRWRGRETGESEIEFKADQKVYFIKFLDPKGFTLEGTFGSTILGYDCKFTGEKVGKLDGGHINAGNEWADHSERAWERERSGRWGGSRW